MRWHGEQTGRWTCCLIPELATWLNIEHGEVAFYLAQALSGHGCFDAYLSRFQKRDEEMCCHCDSPVDNLEHALFMCAKWGAAREALDQAVGSELTPDTMVPLMLQSERFWTLIESFVTLVMRTREFDGRRETNNGEGQWKSHRGLYPRSCVSGRLGCPRRSGEASVCSSPGWRGCTVCPLGVWPRMEVPSERMTEESYATLMEPITREVI